MPSHWADDHESPDLLMCGTMACVSDGYSVMTSLTPIVMASLWLAPDDFKYLIILVSEVASCSK